MIAPTYLREVSFHSQNCHTVNASQGKGHLAITAMSHGLHPSSPVLGQHMHTEMSKNNRPISTRGPHKNAAMPKGTRLSRGGSDDLRSNVTSLSPFPTSYRGSVLDRRNAKDDAPPPNLGHLKYAAMLIVKRPILTRGHHSNAAMPVKCRLATKEIQYGYKI